MKLEGTIKLINDTETFYSGFTKRVIVLTTKEQYPQEVAIDFVRDKTTILDSYKVGDEVTVAINIRGNEYKGKYYVNLTGWKITKGTEFKGVTTPAMKEAEYILSLEPSSGDDDLPF